MSFLFCREFLAREPTRRKASVRATFVGSRTRMTDIVRQGKLADSLQRILFNLSRFSHQQKAPEQKLRCFFVAASFRLANPPDAKRRYGQRLPICVANDGHCPSRQTCRFASANPVQPVPFLAPKQKDTKGVLFCLPISLVYQIKTIVLLTNSRFCANIYLSDDL